MQRQYLVQQAISIMNINQNDLAEIMGVHRSSVSKWLTGTDYFEDRRVFQLMHYYNKIVGNTALFSKILGELENGYNSNKIKREQKNNR